jgi:hypothetical protein
MAMADKNRCVHDANTTRDDQIPLWLAVHEAGHVIARIQLVAAWRLAGLDDPVCLDSVQVWLDPAGTPRGLCRWGYEEPLSFRYNSIISAAGPTAEARIRDADPYDCLTAGEDYDIIMRSVRRGLADVDEALREASFIVGSCWPDIVKLGTHLQTHRELAFPEISALLDLKNGRCIYDESTRPETRHGLLRDVQ